MAVVKISDLPSATLPLTGAELTPVVQSGVTRKVAVSAFSNSDAVNVKSFGAVGNGTTDDTAAINAAIAAAGVNSCVFFPSGTYLVTATLQMLSGQCFYGEGGSVSALSTIKKGATCDLINMVGACSVKDLHLDCVGTSYGGRGIYVSSSISQIIENVFVSNSVTYALEYQAIAGSGSFVTNFTANMIAASQDFASIKVGENYPTNVPRFFQNIWLSNSKFDLTNTVSFTLTSFYCRGFITGPTYNVCVLNRISNGRVSQPAGGTQVFTCADTTISNVAFAQYVRYTDCQGLFAANCLYGLPLTVDDDVRFSQIWELERTYNPVWGQTSGTGPSIGNGTIDARYVYNGAVVRVQILVTMGSTTTYGDGTGAWTFSLPRIATNAAQRSGGVYIKQDSATKVFVAEWAIGALEKQVALLYGNASVRLDWPYTWATGDTLYLTFDYLPR